MVRMMLIRMDMYTYIYKCGRLLSPKQPCASRTKEGQEAKVGWHARGVRLGLVLKVLETLPEVAQKHVLAHKLPVGRTGGPIKLDSHGAHYNISIQIPFPGPCRRTR